MQRRRPYNWQQESTPLGWVHTMNGITGFRVRGDTGALEDVVKHEGTWYRNSRFHPIDDPYENRRVGRQAPPSGEIIDIPPLGPEPGPRPDYWNLNWGETQEQLNERAHRDLYEWNVRRREHDVNLRMHHYRTWLDRYNTAHNTRHPLRYEHLYSSDEELQQYYDNQPRNLLDEVGQILQPGLILAGGMSKRPKIEDAEPGEPEDKGAAGAAITTAHRLFGIHYYKCDFTIVRKQHLTIAQCKPGESTINQYYITCLPVQLLEFWIENTQGSRFRDPFNTISGGFDYASYNNAHVRLSHFVPLQNALQGTTQTDIPAFNTAPYAYVAQDNLGIIKRIRATEHIDHSTMVQQAIKLPSSTWWTNENDEGLLALDDVKTLGQNETLYLNFKFDNQFNRLKQRRPTWAADTLHYLPQALTDGSSNLMIAGMTYNYQSQADPQQKSIIHAIPKRDIPFTFIFLPHIEKVSTGENATRLYAHLLMETSINITLWSIPDGSEQLDMNKEKNMLNQITIGTNQNDLFAQSFLF